MGWGVRGVCSPNSMTRYCFVMAVSGGGGARGGAEYIYYFGTTIRTDNSLVIYRPIL